MSELANETMRYASGVIRGVRDGASFLKMLLQLLRGDNLTFVKPGEMTPEKFFDKNSKVKLDDFVKNNSSKEEFDIFKDCLKSAKVQYAVQPLGDNNYKIYFKADDVSRINYAMGEFTKKMDELEKSKTQEKATPEQFKSEESNANRANKLEKQIKLEPNAKEVKSALQNSPWGKVQHYENLGFCLYVETENDNNGFMFPNDKMEGILSSEAQKIGFAKDKYTCFPIKDSAVRKVFSDELNIDFFYDSNNDKFFWHKLPQDVKKGLEFIVKKNINEEKYNILNSCLDSAKVEYGLSSIDKNTYRISFAYYDAQAIQEALKQFEKRVDDLEQQKAEKQTEVTEQSREYQEQNETEQQGGVNTSKEQKSAAKENNISDKSVKDILKDGVAGAYKSMLDTAEKGIDKLKNNSTKDALLDKVELSIKNFKTDLKEKFTDNSPITDEDMNIDSVFEAAEYEAEAHNAEMDKDISQDRQRDVSL